LWSTISKTFEVIKREGVAGIQKRIRHLRIVSSHLASPQQSILESYEQWLQRNGTIANDYPRWLLRTYSHHPMISIVCPVYEPDPEFLLEAVSSVLGQSYRKLELILVDDKSPSFDLSAFVAQFDDSRISIVQRTENGNISAATNSGIEKATGSHIAFMDQDDLLAMDALLWVAASLVKFPHLKLVYSDEDKLDESGDRCDPHFKPDWNYHYFQTCNYICHLVVVEAGLVKASGGCRLGFEGAQDFDFLLRVTEQIDACEIYHIPIILYHWRKHAGSTSADISAKPEAVNAGLLAIQEHISRKQLPATAVLNLIRYQVEYEVTDEPVTIIIPTRNMHSILKPCIDSIRKLTSYQNYRILIIDNGSDDPDSLAYLDSIKSIATIITDNREFNFAALINHAVEQCETDLICLVNNDVEVITPQWLSEMIGIIQQDQVQVVGAKLLYDDNSVQHGGVILGIGGVAGHAHKFFSADSGGYSDRNVCRQELSAVTGACLLTRKTVFEEVGGMDDQNLTIAFNDVDYCLKVRNAGYKIVWTPHARLYHHESKSRGHEDSPKKVRRFNRETEAIKASWGNQLARDPAYNPNLSLEFEDYRLAANPPPFRIGIPAFQSAANSKNGNHV
ncbi:MAG: GT2 family glycosyltransferase, partial [Porticoccaceae bacterium]